MMTEVDNWRWFNERVEAFVDGELAAAERQRFEQRLATDQRLQATVADATKLREQLRQLPTPRAPAALKRGVIEATGTHWFTHRNTGWLVAGAASAALVVSLSWQLLPQATLPPTGEIQLTASEIAKGRQDLALALAYLDQATTHAGRKVGSAWVNDGLIKPLSNGLNPAGLNRRPELDKDEV